MKRLVLLRPEPGLSASAARAEALGMDVVRCPLFEVRPLPWQAPDPKEYDALLITSANAMRCGGEEVDQLKSLPAYAVGEATATAARDQGFKVWGVGTGGATELLRDLPEGLRLLHLAGTDRHESGVDRQIDAVAVYEAAEIAEPGLPDLDGAIIAVHSPRAGSRLAQLVGDRAASAVVAISEPAAAACGKGWKRIAVAASPNDETLLALAAELCQTGPR